MGSARSVVGRAARSLPLTTLDRAQLEADVLWLCVPDAAIPRVTSRLLKRVGKRGLAGQIVVHSSGASVRRCCKQPLTLAPPWPRCIP